MGARKHFRKHCRFQNREYSEKCMPLTVQDCYLQKETGSENDACNTQLMKKSITSFPFELSLM
jgi:hypothetical protein